MKKVSIQNWVKDNWLFVSFIASATYFFINFYIRITNLENGEPAMVSRSWANQRKIDSLITILTIHDSKQARK